MLPFAGHSIPPFNGGGVRSYARSSTRRQTGQSPPSKDSSLRVRHNHHHNSVHSGLKLRRQVEKQIWQCLCLLEGKIDVDRTSSGRTCALEVISRVLAQAKDLSEILFVKQILEVCYKCFLSSIHRKYNTRVSPPALVQTQLPPEHRFSVWSRVA